MKTIKTLAAATCFMLSYVIAVQAANFTSLIGASFVIDAGFYQAYWGFPPAAETYTNNQPNNWQQFNFVDTGNGFTICNSPSKACLSDGGNVVFIGQGIDTWLVTAQGSGWIIKDIRTGRYMGAIPSVLRGNVAMSATPVILPLTPINGSLPGAPSPTPSTMPTPAPSTMPITANDFLKSLGAVTHVIQGRNTPAQVIAAIRYSGLRNIREDATHDPSMFANLCNIHTQSGAMIDELAIVDSGAADISSSLTEYDSLAYCGGLLAAEGANEPNNFGFTYNGQKCSTGGSYLACAQHQIDLYKAVHSDPHLAGKQVWAESEPGAEPDNQGLQFLTIPSGAGTIQPSGTTFADAANLHNYIEGNGQRSVADNQAWNAESTGAAAGADGLAGEFIGKTWNRGFSAAPLSAGPAMPKVTTETAWPSTTISQDQQGKLYVNLFLSATKLKWSYTFIYLMFEEPSSVGYGIFTQDGKPKLAATYLHNLTTILSDASSGFTPTGLGYSIASEPATVHDLLMQKITGTYELAIWNDAPVGEGSKDVLVDLGSTFSTVKVYDVTKGTSAVQILTNVISIPLNLTDHAVILEFVGP